MKSIKYITIAILCIVMTAPVHAQKYGYIDSQQLLVDHPDMQKADSEIKAYSDQLMVKGEKLVTDFEAAYNKLVEEADNLAPVQIKEREARLGEQQQAIQAYEQEMQQKIAAKREQLIAPILDEVKVAIESVGKDEGYTMIFDLSTGFLLHAEPSQDLLQTVKGKLGI